MDIKDIKIGSKIKVRTDLEKLGHRVEGDLYLSVDSYDELLVNNSYTVVQIDSTDESIQIAEVVNEHEGYWLMADWVEPEDDGTFLIPTLGEIVFHEDLEEVPLCIISVYEYGETPADVKFDLMASNGNRFYDVPMESLSIEFDEVVAERRQSKFFREYGKYSAMGEYRLK